MVASSVDVVASASLLSRRGRGASPRTANLSLLSATAAAAVFHPDEQEETVDISVRSVGRALGVPQLACACLALPCLPLSCHGLAWGDLPAWYLSCLPIDAVTTVAVGALLPAAAAGLLCSRQAALLGVPDRPVQVLCP